MVVGTAVVLSANIYFSKEEGKILELIQQLAMSIPKCTSCGKQIPQGNFDFCPFCGNPLKKRE
jgi:rRNA maturation endonuclease Nob1